MTNAMQESEDLLVFIRQHGDTMIADVIDRFGWSSDKSRKELAKLENTRRVTMRETRISRTRTGSRIKLYTAIPSQDA